MMERKPWLKSTGPRTAEGKASRNSRKHGLRSTPAGDIAKQRTAAGRPDKANELTIKDGQADIAGAGDDMTTPRARGGFSPWPRRSCAFDS